jgi:hypothetical protein
MFWRPLIKIKFLKEMSLARTGKIRKAALVSNSQGQRFKESQQG